MSSQQTSTGAHEAYTKYDESLGRRNSSRLPDTRQGSQRTRSNRPHSMHERANSLRNTQTGERITTPSKRWTPHVDVPNHEAFGRGAPGSPEPQLGHPGHVVPPHVAAAAPPPQQQQLYASSLPSSPEPLVTAQQIQQQQQLQLQMQQQMQHQDAYAPMAAAAAPTAYGVMPISTFPPNNNRSTTPQSWKSATPPGALVPANAAAPGMTLQLSVPKDLTEAITDLRDSVVHNTDLLSQLISKQPGGNGDDAAAKKKPVSLHEPIKKAFKVMVECKVIFLKIGEIETLKEQYNAEVYVQAKWREPELDGLSAEKLAEVDFNYYWNPNLYVENAQSQTKEKVWSTAVLDEVGECYIIERRRMKGVFAETLELNDFPFDCQDLTVTITTERSEKELELVPDLKEDSAVNLTQFVEQQEWTIHQYIETNIALRFNEYSYSKQKHPVFAVTSRASRKPGYFYWNIFLVMFFISTLSFATFSVKPELPQNRLQLTFTLLLTKVAFKFTVSQSLPRISYLTYLDKYILAMMIMLYMVCIWFATVTALSEWDKEWALGIDNYAFYTMVCIYLGFHIVFALWLYFDACQGRRSMFMKDKEMQRKIAETNKKQQDDLIGGS